MRCWSQGVKAQSQCVHKVRPHFAGRCSNGCRRVQAGALTSARAAVASSLAAAAFLSAAAARASACAACAHMHAASVHSSSRAQVSTWRLAVQARQACSSTTSISHQGALACRTVQRRGCLHPRARAWRSQQQVSCLAGGIRLLCRSQDMHMPAPGALRGSAAPHSSPAWRPGCAPACMRRVCQAQQMS